MAKEKLLTRDKFYAGTVRDDKSEVVGAMSNIEEMDIFENVDYIRPAQILSADSMPASTEIYAYDGDDGDVIYGYGKETSGNEVRIVSVASGGADNPGSFSTLFTSSSGDAAKKVSDFKWFKTSEDSDGYLYYVSGTNTLKRYSINSSSESTVGTLDGLSGTDDRPTMKVIFGELYVCHNKYIAKIDDDGVFTQHAFTLPREWEGIDIIPVSDVAIILARHNSRKANYCKGFWWDLTESVQVDDSFHIPFGGPQWIENHKETIKIFCAINGVGRFYQLSGAFPGAVPIQLPNIEFQNIGTETSTQPISSPKMVDTKDGVLYFCVYKTDKTGLYALGQLDNNKPIALVLMKRFHTSDYSKHTPYGFKTQGPNFYVAFDDDGTASNARCESNNSPTRSSNAVIESVWENAGSDFKDKDWLNLFIFTYPLSASTSITPYLAGDYGSYSAITREDGSVFNTTNGVLARLAAKGFGEKKVVKAKLTFTSNSTNAIKLVAFALHVDVGEDLSDN